MIDLQEKCCRIMGKRLPLLVAPEVNQPQLVTVQADTVVPPRSEAIIPGMVKQWLGDQLEGMLEPSLSLSQHCDVLVARVMCRVDQGVLPVRVINVTDEPLTLRQGMKVGTLFTDVEVESEADMHEVREVGGPAQPWSVEGLLRQFGLEQKGFDAAQLQGIRDLLYRNISVFSCGDTDLGRTRLTSHRIDTGDAAPVKLPPRRVPLHLQKEVGDHIKQMQEHGIIRPSCSPWAAPVVF